MGIENASHDAYENKENQTQSRQEAAERASFEDMIAQLGNEWESVNTTDVTAKAAYELHPEDQSALEQQDIKNPDLAGLCEFLEVDENDRQLLRKSGVTIEQAGGQVVFLTDAPGAQKTEFIPKNMTSVETAIVQENGQMMLRIWQEGFESEEMLVPLAHEPDAVKSSLQNVLQPYGDKVTLVERSRDETRKTITLTVQVGHASLDITVKPRFDAEKKCVVPQVSFDNWPKKPVSLKSFLDETREDLRVMQEKGTL